jgi:hypothetical protein
MGLQCATTHSSHSQEHRGDPPSLSDKYYWQELIKRSLTLSWWRHAPRASPKWPVPQARHRGPTWVSPWYDVKAIRTYRWQIPVWQIMIDPGKLIGRGLVLHIFWWQCYTFVLTLTAPENNCCLGKQCPLSWRVWKLGCAVISLPILWVVLNVLCSLYIVHFWMLATYSSVSHPIMKYFRTFWCHIKVESISYSYICKQLNP